jgi:drug/metabolite transporter (DMT)-like permease
MLIPWLLPAGHGIPARKWIDHPTISSHAGSMNSMSDNLRGALFMMASMAGFVFNDTLMKLASADLGMFQAIFLRGVFATMLIGALAWRLGVLGYRLRKADRGLVVLRTSAEIGATICFLNALFHMPIANATAILQAMPLAIALAASIFLGETIGWRRYLAIASGCFGMLLIVRPGATGFSAYSLSAVAAVGFLVLRDLVTRRLGPEVPSVFVAFISAAVITVAGGLLSLAAPWGAVAWHHVLMLAVAAVFVLAGYLFGIMTMRVGDIGFISPFRYTVLLWAMFLGFLVFGDRPDLLTIVGSAIIVVTGLYTFYRERQVARLAVLARVRP